MLTLNEILESTKGNIIKGEEEFNGFKSLCTDTRKIEKDSIFVALKGENFNGNKFVNDALKKGSTVAIIDEEEYLDKNLEGTIIKVEDTKMALLNLAKKYRQKLGIKVIGVTGSTGKTSTKDIVAALLSEKYKVFKTKGNFNNEIGLPLMIFSMDKSYDIAILEMGMSNSLEIHRLAESATPDIALITNVGISHIENLKTRENILKAKMEITDFFNKENVLILNNDNDMLKTVENKDYKIIRTSIEDRCDISATDIKLTEGDSTFKIEFNNKIKEFKMPLPGKHNIQNCLLGIGAALELGLSIEEMERGLKNLEATSMRLEVIKKDNLTLVNDCYNASPDSIKSSIETLKNIDGKRKVAILGTMRELGNHSYEAHKEVGVFAKENGIELLLVTGEYSDGYIDGFYGENSINYKTKEELINDLSNKLRKQDVVLVKASRGMKFEDISNKILEIKL